MKVPPESTAFLPGYTRSQTRSVFEAGLHSAGIQIRCAVEMGSREAVREAVALELGLGVVARTAFIPDPRLVELPISDMHLHTHAHLICLKERRGASLIARFLEAAQHLSPAHDTGVD